jgi:hypothetical protein
MWRRTPLPEVRSRRGAAAGRRRGDDSRRGRPAAADTGRSRTGTRGRAVPVRCETAARGQPWRSRRRGRNQRRLLVVAGAVVDQRRAAVGVAEDVPLLPAVTVGRGVRSRGLDRAQGVEDLVDEGVGAPGLRSSRARIRRSRTASRSCRPRWTSSRGRAFVLPHRACPAAPMPACTPSTDTTRFTFCPVAGSGSAASTSCARRSNDCVPVYSVAGAAVGSRWCPGVAARRPFRGRP